MYNVHNTESTELLLNDLSLDLMKDNIIDQIKSDIPSDYPTDFCSIVINKYYNIINNPQNADYIQDLNYEMIDFCTDIIRAIDDKFDLIINHSMDNLGVITLMRTLYDFFILRRIEFIKSFFKTYIYTHRDSLTEALNLSERSKDVTTIANKKRNISKQNIPIVSNIQEVMTFIISSGISRDEFIDTIYDGDIAINNIKNLIDECVINGDFANSYISETIDEYSSDITASIRNDLRYSFYNN